MRPSSSPPSHLPYSCPGPLGPPTRFSLVPAPHPYWPHPTKPHLLFPPTLPMTTRGSLSNANPAWTFPCLKPFISPVPTTKTGSPSQGSPALPALALTDRCSLTSHHTPLDQSAPAPLALSSSPNAPLSFPP